MTNGAAARESVAKKHPTLAFQGAGSPNEANVAVHPLAHQQGPQLARREGQAPQGQQWKAQGQQQPQQHQ